MKYFILTEDHPKGPLSEEEVRLEVKKGRILSSANICREGDDKWITISECFENLEYKLPPSPSSQELGEPSSTAQKSRSISVLFAGVVITLLAITATLTFIFNKNENTGAGADKGEGITAEKSRVFVSDPIITNASQESPFENSLGMRFVPVPITGGFLDGQSILFSIWETRRVDYQNYIKVHPERAWVNPRYEVTNEHPVSMISWQGAQDFAKWLTEEERNKGVISDNVVYRLPSDHEWSCAVGIGSEEDAQASPDSKHMKVTIYPWGANYPPLGKAGNYYGEEMTDSLIDDRRILAGYNDGFVRLAPVGRFSPNQFGLYDMGGNLWEWCEDLYTQAEDDRVLRGASWMNQRNTNIYSSTRRSKDPSLEDWAIGFRLVLVPVLAE